MNDSVSDMSMLLSSL